MDETSTHSTRSAAAADGSASRSKSRWVSTATKLKTSKRSVQLWSALPKDRYRALRAQAKRTVLANHIVRLTKLEPGSEQTSETEYVLNARNEPLKVERFPVLPRRGDKLSSYRCSVAVALYLQFLAEGSWRRGLQTVSWQA